MTNTPETSPPSPPAGGRSRRGLMVVAFLAFISLGLPDGTLGVAWPSIRAQFELPLSALGVLLVAGAVGYLTSSTQSGHLLASLGVGRLLLISTVLTAVASLGFAVVPSWPALVALAVIGGLGAGAIDAGTNAFAASNFSPATLTWLHACYGIGAAAGPLVMSGVLAQGLPWQVGYAIQAGLLGALAILFFARRHAWLAVAERSPMVDNQPPRARIADTLRRPVVWNMLLLFFLYTGLEATAGSWAYSLLTLSRGWEPGPAGLAVSGYWGALTVGRVFFGFVARGQSATAVARWGLAIAPVGALLLAIGDGAVPTALGLWLMSFGLAPIFPCLVAETPRRVGPHLADHAVSLQVSAAYVGLAGVPSATGIVMRAGGLEWIGPILVVGLLVLVALHEVPLLWVRRT